MKVETENRRKLADEIARHARAARETAAFARSDPSFDPHTRYRLDEVACAWGDVLLSLANNKHGARADDPDAIAVYIRADRLLKMEAAA